MKHSCRSHSNMAGKVTFVATLTAATICILCGSGKASSMEEDEITFGNALSCEVSEVVMEITAAPEPQVVEETTVQFVQKSSVDTEELVVNNVVDVVGRDNILYYIMDDGIRANVPTEWQDYLWNKCVEYDITEHYELLFAQIYHESGWNPDAVSGTKDYGLMQINIKNHEWLKETLGITDFLDPYESMDAGTYMMSIYLQKYNDVQTALVCYNMGEGKVLEGITSSKYSNGVVKDMDKLFILEEEEGK